MMSSHLPVSDDHENDVYISNTVIEHNIEQIFDPFDHFNDPMMWPFDGQEIASQTENTSRDIITRTHGNDDGDFVRDPTKMGYPIGEYCSRQYSICDDSRVNLDQPGQSEVLMLPFEECTMRKISKSRHGKRKIHASYDKIKICSEEGTSNTKKTDHNARERIRRMKLNASYLSLRALLLDSRRSKKRWSAPLIIDKVLKYIPEIVNEIQHLRSKKQNIINGSSSSTSAEAIKNHKILIDDDRVNIPSCEDKHHTVSINKVNKDEVIYQICMKNIEGEPHRCVSVFEELLQNIEEDKGIQVLIKSASMLRVCESRICYHLHVQMNQTSSHGAERIEDIIHRVMS